MGKYSPPSIIIVLVIAFASAISTNAAEYIVDWISPPPDGDSNYTKWASNIRFKQNDVLIFYFIGEGNNTNIAEINKTIFDNCNVNQNIPVLVSGIGTTFTLNRTGEFYFTCTLPGNCVNGRKLCVNVSASSPPSAPPPSSSGTTPTPPTNKGVMPSSSSMQHFVISALIIVLVLNLLF